MRQKGYASRFATTKYLVVGSAGTFSLGRTFDGSDWKNVRLRNQLFQKLDFFFHKAILGLDLRGYACAMDMVDNAFERGDVGLFKPGIDYAIGGKFITLRRKRFT